MSAPDQPTVGDLPFLQSTDFLAPGEHRHYRYRFLEHVQLCLLEDSEEGDVDINSTYRFGRRKGTHYGVSFHQRILPHWEAFAAAKERQGGMQSFRINDIDLPPAPFFADALMPALQSSNDTLIRLDLVKCKLESSGLVCVADFLTDNASLAVLDLSENKIDSVDDAKFLALAIWNHPELNFVNLSDCGLGKTEGVLAEVLGGAGNLETLLLDYNEIDAAGMALVAEVLADSTAMTVLSVGNNHFNQWRWPLEERSRMRETFADNAVVIGKALKKNTSLRQLSLGHCHGLEVPTFLNSKRATELLAFLDLKGNGIGKEGGEMIADYLNRNPALVELDLSWNRLSRAAESIANALKSNDTLQHLDLSGNYLGDKVVPFFAEMLRNNNTLLSLKMNYTDITIKSGARKKLIKKALCDTSSLDAIVDSNHTCELTFSSCRNDTYEAEMRNINALEDEAQKIRYKVVLAFFAFDKDLFSPRTFDDVSLELMPRLLHLVQQEIGYGGFGEGVVETTRKRRKSGFDPTLARLYEVVSGWNQLPLLFVRGPGKLKKKRKRKRHVMSFKEDEDEEWTPRSR